jgi:membrane protease subunit HflK
MYIETMQQIYQNTTKVMVDAKSASPMLYVPLDQLLKQGTDQLARPSGAVVTTTPPSSPTPTAPGSEVDRREILRNRDAR